MPNKQFTDFSVDVNPSSNDIILVWDDIAQDLRQVTLSSLPLPQTVNGLKGTVVLNGTNVEATDGTTVSQPINNIITNRQRLEAAANTNNFFSFKRVLNNWENVVTPGNWWMSTINPGGVEDELLASGGGYYLYRRDTAVNPGDTALTAAEANTAQYSRVFADYTGYTLYQRVDATKPIAEADYEVLRHVEDDIRGYYYSLDLTVEEIGQKLAIFSEALGYSQAGSIELTIAAVSNLLTTQSDTSTIHVFDPDRVRNNYTREVLNGSDVLKSEHGVNQIEFNATDDKLIIEFQTVPAMSLFLYGYLYITIDGVQHLMSLSEVDNKTIVYTLPVNVVDNVVAATQSGTVNISFQASPSSPALNSGEIEVVQHAYDELLEHLAKYPR